MEHFNIQKFLQEPDRMTALLHEMLDDVVWKKPTSSSIEPPPLYENQVYIPFSFSSVEARHEKAYVEALVRYFHEGIEKATNDALALVPGLVVFPDMSDRVEDWVERFLVHLVKEDPRYTCHMETENLREDFHGKKMVFIRTLLNIVPLGPNEEPVLVWVATSDAYRYDAHMYPPGFKFVQNIESEISE